MKIDRIIYKKIFPIGPYQNHSIGVEIQLDEYDNIDESFLKAKAKVEEWAQSELVPDMEAGNPVLPTVGLDVPKTMTEVIENEKLKNFWAEQMNKKLAK